MSDSKPPVQAFPGGYHNASGMTLRDYFAAQAAPEAMRSVAFQQVQVNPGEEPQDAVARIAYDVADALLRRREVSK